MLILVIKSSLMFVYYKRCLYLGFIFSGYLGYGWFFEKNGLYLIYMIN